MLLSKLGQYLTMSTAVYIYIYIYTSLHKTCLLGGDPYPAAGWVMGWRWNVYLHSDFSSFFLQNWLYDGWDPFILDTMVIHHAVAAVWM